MKLCSKCNQNLKLKFFGKNTNGRSGKRSTCKRCTNSENRKRYKERNHLWQKSKFNGTLKRLYNITTLDFESLLNQQQNKCKICKNSDFGRKTANRFSVDHCHKTGKVRGLLCSVCNTIVGLIEKRNVE